MRVDIRPVARDDLSAVATLIEAAFDAGIAPHYSDAGCATFRNFAIVERIRARLVGESDGWVATGAAGAVLGYVEMTGDHVRMLFIRPDRQRCGIGQRLLEHVLSQRGNRDITVNSAPNSDGFYRRMGFEPTGPCREENGIAFTPMARPSGRAPPAPRRPGSSRRR